MMPKYRILKDNEFEKSQYMLWFITVLNSGNDHCLNVLFAKTLVFIIVNNFWNISHYSNLKGILKTTSYIFLGNLKK